jgi:hypothetical protein
MVSTNRERGTVMSAMLWERRRSFRIPVSGKALLQYDGQLHGLYEVDDVSIDGCSLHKHGDMNRRAARVASGALRKHVNVAIRVEGASEIEMPARVVRQSSDGDVALLGLRFTHANPAFEDFIQDLVMDSLENERDQDEVLVVHAHPERENALFDAMRGLGHRIVAARTPRDAVSILEHAAENIRIALVADVVGTSRARDIVKLILRRFPHVQCVRMSHGGAQRLLGAIREAALGKSKHDAWSLSRLRKVVSATQKHATAS